MVPLIRLYALHEAAVRGDWNWLQATRSDAANDFASARRIPSRINPSLYNSMGPSEGEADRFTFWHDIPGLPTSQILASCGAEGVYYLWDGSSWRSDEASVSKAIALVHMGRDDVRRFPNDWRDVIDVSNDE